MKRLLYSVLSIALLTCGASPAFAVDGVVLIDQNRALAGNVTPGDTPGFPVTLSVTGSYRLSGNLTVPANADGIVIAADFVTLDLNGFTIAGGFGSTGIVTNGVGLLGTTIRNGIVANFLDGIDLARFSGNRSSSVVEGIRAIGNTVTGILVGKNSIVRDCVAVDNGTGIRADSASVIRGNTASANFSAGIFAGANSIITGNTASNNQPGGIGLHVACPSNAVGNTFFANSTNIVDVGNSCTFANNLPAVP